MSGQIKAKVTARVDYGRTRPPSPLKAYSRPGSPIKTGAISTPASPTRPRAKVSSSAAVGARKVASPPSTGHTTRLQHSVPTTRAPSPFKSLHSTPSTPASVVKAKVTGLARSSVSATGSTPSLPELRQRATTSLPGDPVKKRIEHTRRGSISSQVSTSTTSFPRRTALFPTQSRASSEDNGSLVGTVRVRSRVSHEVEHTPSMVHSVPPSPSYVNGTRQARVPSVSKLSPSPPSRSATPNSNGTLSPTLSAPVPAHHRFATSGDTLSPKVPIYDTRQPHDDLLVDYTSHPPIARVDPAHIPLPPHSPPSSTVSFSSRSSASRSSTSYDIHASDSSRSSVPTLNSRPNGNTSTNGIKHTRSRSSVDGLGIHISPIFREASALGSPVDDANRSHDSDENEGDPARKLRDEAKSNRKIADLEITNRSLLAINSTLEATKRKQAKEIRDLRRRLRESILVLPPVAYRAAKTSMTQEGTLKDEEEEEEDEHEDDPEDEAIIEGTTDDSYRRVKTLLESLIESGKQALESKPEDFVGTASGGLKVLDEEEARTWRGEEPDVRSLLEDTDSASQFDDPSRPLTPSRVAIPDDEFTSEDEVEASLILTSDDSASLASPLPPITVTPSPPV